MADVSEDQQAAGGEEADQDALMAEWEAMAEDGGEDGGEEDGGDGSSMRVLDQDEIDSPLGLVGWFLSTHTGRTFGYPLGAANGGSLLTVVLFVVGIKGLLELRRRTVLAMLLLPFVLMLGAAVLQRYPYGGSGRISQHLAPAICLLAGLGLARLLAFGSSPRPRRRLAYALGFLIVFGLCAAVSGLGIGQVDRSVARVVWIKGHIEHPALARGDDLRRTLHWCRQHAVGADQANRAFPLGHDHPAVRQEGKAPGMVQARGHRDDAQAVVIGLYGFGRGRCRGAEQDRARQNETCKGA